MTATLYQSVAAGRHRLVVVLPIWGSSKYPSRTVIRRLLASREGERTHVLEVHGARPLFDWPALGGAAGETELRRELAKTIEHLSNTVADVRRLIGWAERREGVDPGRLGLVGFSMGAIVGSLVMGQDTRLAAGALVMGGAHLHEAFGTCRGKPGQARRQIRQRFGWDGQTFIRKVEGPLSALDPARFAVNVHPSRVLFIDAALDRCMPQTARDDLWEALGRPERISLTYGHQMAFFSMTPMGFRYTTRRIVDFLDRLLLDSVLPRRVASPAQVTSLAPR